MNSRGVSLFGSLGIEPILERQIVPNRANLYQSGYSLIQDVLTAYCMITGTKNIEEKTNRFPNLLFPV